MKSRVLFFLLLFLILFMLMTRNDHRVHDTLLGVISPIKNAYKTLTESVSDRGKSYLFQKENIQKLTRENKQLRKYLLDQTQYIQQVASLFKKIPSLTRLPYHNMELIDTISYIRLNSFNEIMLTRPSKALLDEQHVYGLIQNDVVGGTAVLRGDHLYGYLTSNPRCRFGVFIGKERSPGIAKGIDRETMAVRFIPKWAKVDIGDRVETSGLDGIFFANVPVGVVKKVTIDNSYKTAFIKTYDDTFHPDYYFMITDPTPYLTSSYDKDTVQLGETQTPAATVSSPEAITEKTIASIPEAVQTQDNIVDPTEFEIPQEEVRKEAKPAAVPPRPKPTPPVKHVTKPKPKSKSKPKVTPTPKPADAGNSAPEGVLPSEVPATVPKPKRKSAMDILNGR